jgi:hypothetical protein
MSRNTPFVLPQDLSWVEAFNGALSSKDRQAHTIVTDLPPNPFAGPFNAPVVLLLANPGSDPNDLIEQRSPAGVELIYKNLSGEQGGPGWVFHDHFRDMACGRWWRSRTRDLAAELGSYDLLAERLLMVEFHGYHSKSWTPPFVTFPSQHFGFALVRHAMRRGALIIVGRAMRHWYAAVPGLQEYENKIEGLTSPRSANLSVRNLGPNFGQVVAALRSARRTDPPIINGRDRGGAPSQVPLSLKDYKKEITRYSAR